MKIIGLKSYSFSKKIRKIPDIKLLIIHYTGMQSMRAALNRLISHRYKVSCHYLISREGKIFQIVDASGTSIFLLVVTKPLSLK